MSKMRIYELAKQLGVANKELMEKMKSVGMEANSHMSMIEESDAAGNADSNTSKLPWYYDN